MPYATLDLCPQETRRIVSAEFQHVTYDEWLPLVLDGATMSQYRLTEGTFEYDPNLNPTVSNVFSTAVFRFGHSQIKQVVQVRRTGFKSTLEFLYSQPSLFLLSLWDLAGWPYVGMFRS